MQREQAVDLLGALDDVGEVAELLRRVAVPFRGRAPGPSSPPEPDRHGEAPRPRPQSGCDSCDPLQIETVCRVDARGRTRDDARRGRGEADARSPPMPTAPLDPSSPFHRWPQVERFDKGRAPRNSDRRMSRSGRHDRSFSEETRRLDVVVLAVEIPADGPLDALAVVEGGGPAEPGLGPWRCCIRGCGPSARSRIGVISGGRARRVRRPCASRTKAVGVDQRVGDASGHGGRAGGLGEEVEELAPG